MYRYIIVSELNFYLSFVFQDAVPGGATVILEVEMLAVKDQLDILDQFHRMDKNKDGALDAMEVKIIKTFNRSPLIFQLKKINTNRIVFCL